MNTKLWLIWLLAFIVPVAGSAQKPLINKLDSLTHKADSVGGQVNNTSPHAYDEQTKITPDAYVTLLVSDLKQEFTKPFHMKGKDWGNLVRFVATGGALAFSDRPVQRYATGLVSRNPGVRDVSGFITNFGGLYEGFALAAFGAYGVAFKSQKMKTTTLLATQAYITGATLESVVKFISGRTRPSYYAPGTDAIPKFLGPFSKANTGSSSFPSGHTTVAFAAATVFALEYSDKPWVPILAYSSAALIGLSRITENKHWATDVFAGAVVGFLAGRNVVNNYHRFAKLKAGEKKKNKPLSLHIQYKYGHVVPGIIYSF